MSNDFMSTNKLYHHPDRLNAYLNKGLVHPVTVEIHLTNKCNIKCNYCCYNDRKDNREMSFYQALDVLNTLQTMNVKAVVFSGGGEPTMHPKILEIVQHAKDLGLDVGLITNGVKFNNELLPYLKWVRFSVDTANRETYKKIKGVDKLLLVIDNIVSAVEYKSIMHLKTTIGIHAVITEVNQDEVNDIAGLAEGLYVDYFQYRPLERGNTIVKPCLPKGLYNIKIIDTAYKWEELQDTTPYTECLGADWVGVIGVDCNFYICSCNAYDKTASYGNILEDNIFQNRKIIQKNFDYSKCPKACRGAVINKCLSQFDSMEHVNFL